MFLNPEQPIWKHRLNLPHWQQEGTFVFVTWRLADSLPEPVVAKILNQRKDWEADHPKPWNDETVKEYNRLFTLRFEAILDDCHGSCCLKDPSLGRIVVDALHHFDETRYCLEAYVIMPNHVHVLFTIAEERKMEDVLHSWKRFTSREINKKLGRRGQLWQDEYWDRLIRSQRHFDWTKKYIQNNPANLRAGTFHLWQRES